MGSRENLRRGKNQDTRVKNGEKRELWMEWDGKIWAGPRGVYIRLGSALVWQREMWVHLEVIHHLYQGKLQEVDGPASRYVSILPVSFLLPLPLPFIFIWKHEQMWGKQQISAVWLLARSFQLITDEHRGSVVPNYQGGGHCRAPLLSLSWNSWCSHPAVQSLSLFFFFSKMLNLKSMVNLHPVCLLKEKKNTLSETMALSLKITRELQRCSTNCLISASKFGEETARLKASCFTGWIAAIPI